MALTYVNTTSIIFVAVSAWCCKKTSYSAEQSEKTSPPERLMRPLMRSFAPHDWPVRRNSSSGCRADMKLISMKARQTFRADSDNAWRLRARSSLILEFLILDEATSALDADSEAIVNANIARIAHGRTLIIISHRLSSLVSADAIVVLDEGIVQDIGRHEELLARCDIYGSLWHQQTSYITATLNQRNKPPMRVPTRVS